MRVGLGGPSLFQLSRSLLAAAGHCGLRARRFLRSARYAQSASGPASHSTPWSYHRATQWHAPTDP